MPLQASYLLTCLLACMQSENALNTKSPFACARHPACVLLNSKSMGDAANAHQRNIYNKKIPTLEYVDGQVW